MTCKPTDVKSFLIFAKVSTIVLILVNHFCCDFILLCMLISLEPGKILRKRQRFSFQFSLYFHIKKKLKIFILYRLRLYLHFSNTTMYFYSAFIAIESNSLMFCLFNKCPPSYKCPPPLSKRVKINKCTGHLTEEIQYS